MILYDSFASMRSVDGREKGGADEIYDQKG